MLPNKEFPVISEIIHRNRRDYMCFGVILRSFYMAQVSKNARTGSSTHKHECPCGGEVKMRSVFANGKMRNMAVCEKCNRRERRPRDFR